jgi:hypothetical protein
MIWESISESFQSFRLRMASTQRRCCSPVVGLITRTAKKVLNVCANITGSIMKRLEALGQRLSTIGQAMRQMLLDTWQSVSKTLRCSIRSLRKRLRIQDTTHSESACNGILETKGGDAASPTATASPTTRGGRKTTRGKKGQRKAQRSKKND